MATFITGDLNADISSLPTLKNLLDTQSWVDVGAQEHWSQQWAEPGQIAFDTQRACPAPNCWAHNAKGPKRRTYTLCNRQALVMIQWAAVGPWAEFDVHATLTVGIATAEAVRTRKLKQLASLQPTADELGILFQHEQTTEAARPRTNEK